MEPLFLPFINNAFIMVLGLLGSLVIWMAKKLDRRLDEINMSIRDTNKTLAAIEHDLRKDLAGLDRRLTKIETRCSVHHDEA